MKDDRRRVLEGRTRVEVRRLGHLEGGERSGDGEELRVGGERSLRGAAVRVDATAAGDDSAKSEERELARSIAESSSALRTWLESGKAH